MTEYINRDMLIAEGWHMERTIRDMTSMTIEIKRPIDFPAADVVEVVRCKDCLHWIPDGDDEMWCNGWGCYHMRPDGYCYLGERKEG